MAVVIDFDEWRHVQPVAWRLKEGERMYAVYQDAGALEDGIDSYIALTDKRVLIPDWEFLYEDIVGVRMAGFEIGLTLHTLEGNVTLLLLGQRQAGYAYRIIECLKSK